MKPSELYAQYLSMSRLFTERATSVAFDALAQNFKSLNETKKSANQLIELAEQLKEIVPQANPSDPANADFVDSMTIQISSYKQIVAQIDDATLLSVHGSKMTDEGTN